jgi:excisionase family DNA binding protein
MRKLTVLPAAPTAAQAHRLRAEGYRRLAEAEDLAAQLADAAPEPAPGEYVTVRAAAERMACSASQVYDLALRNELASYKHGRTRRIESASIARWLRRHTRREGVPG